MRGRANMADCGRPQTKMRKETRDLMRYTEGVEGVVLGDAKLVELACRRFFLARGMESSGFIPQAHFRKETQPV